MKLKQWKGKAIFILVVLLTLFQTVYASTDHKNLLQVDKIDTSNVSYSQRFFASLVTSIPDTLMKVLNIQDVDTLVFGKNDLAYGTFPQQIWNAATKYFDLSGLLMGFLLLLAFTVWGVFFLYRAMSASDRIRFREMNEGFMVYVGVMLASSYLLELIFKINSFIIQFAIAALSLFNIPTDMKFLDLVASLQNTPSVGGAVIFLVVVVSVGMLNYQYAVRMLVLFMLIILLPGVAYASIYPWSRRAIDMWMKEFTSQVFENAGHALALSGFLVIINLGASDWTLFAFLFGLPHIAGLIRLLLGAPTVGGKFGALGTMAGGGSMNSIMQIASSMKGGKAGMMGGLLSGSLGSMGGNPLQNNASQSSNAPVSTDSTSQLHGGLGGVGLLQNMDKKALAKGAIRLGAKSTAGLAGAMVAGAVTGHAAGAFQGFRLGFQGAEAGGNLIRNLANSNQQPPPPSVSESSTQTPVGNTSPPGVNWVASEKPQESNVGIPSFFSNLGFNEIPKDMHTVNQRVRTLAKTLHPDVTGDSQQFAKITEAAAMAKVYFANQELGKQQQNRSKQEESSSGFKTINLPIQPPNK